MSPISYRRRQHWSQPKTACNFSCDFNLMDQSCARLISVLMVHSCWVIFWNIWQNHVNLLTQKLGTIIKAPLNMRIEKQLGIKLKTRQKTISCLKPLCWKLPVRMILVPCFSPTIDWNLFYLCIVVNFVVKDENNHRIGKVNPYKKVQCFKVKTNPNEKSRIIYKFSSKSVYVHKIQEICPNFNVACIDPDIHISQDGYQCFVRVSKELFVLQHKCFRIFRTSISLCIFDWCHMFFSLIMF